MVAQDYSLLVVNQKRFTRLKCSRWLTAVVQGLSACLRDVLLIFTAEISNTATALPVSLVSPSILVLQDFTKGCWNSCLCSVLYSAVMQKYSFCAPQKSCLIFLVPL